MSDANDLKNERERKDQIISTIEPKAQHLAKTFVSGSDVPMSFIITEDQCNKNETCQVDETEFHTYLSDFTMSGKVRLQIRVGTRKRKVANEESARAQDNIGR